MMAEAAVHIVDGEVARRNAKGRLFCHELSRPHCGQLLRRA